MLQLVLARFIEIPVYLSFTWPKRLSIWSLYISMSGHKRDGQGNVVTHFTPDYKLHVFLIHSWIITRKSRNDILVMPLWDTRYIAMDPRNHNLRL